jgi:hypothetical protein
MRSQLDRLSQFCFGDLQVTTLGCLHPLAGMFLSFLNSLIRSGQEEPRAAGHCDKVDDPMNSMPSRAEIAGPFFSNSV